MPVSEATYMQVALEDGDSRWELWCGELVEKPSMTFEHYDVLDRLYRRLARQLDEDEFAMRSDGGRLRTSGGSHYVPDLFVVARGAMDARQTEPGLFDMFEEPVLLVVEVWSPSTGHYDQTSKLAEYKRRGDQEIWFIHPYERTLTAWRKQPDGSYTDMLYRGGMVRPVALPGAVIDLDTLFGQQNHPIPEPR